MIKMRPRLILMLISTVFVLAVRGSVPCYGGIKESKAPPGYGYSIESISPSMEVSKAMVYHVVTMPTDFGFLSIVGLILPGETKTIAYAYIYTQHKWGRYWRRRLSFIQSTTNTITSYKPRGKLINYAS